MNPSTNPTEQQGDPNWSTDGWDNAAAAVSGLSLEARGQYNSNRLEWDWESQSMILAAQHPGGPASGGSADMSEEQRKSQQISASSMATNLRAYSTILSTPGFPPNFTQNPLGIFSSAGIRSFGGMDASSSLPTSSSHQGALGSSGIPGLAATSGGHGDLRSYEQQRRRFFGQMDLDKAVQLTPTIKQEEVTQPEIGHARIGLNLGVRTYFSTEDTAAGRMNKRHRANSPGSQVPMCQAEGCKADLSQAKHYHRRHKVCELHSKAANVIAAGHTQRFCQQCSRFHLLSEFDEGKRSCRKRLADHNRRRRKPQPTVSTSGTTGDSMALVKVEDQDNRVNGSGGSLHRSPAGYGRPDERMQSIMLPGGLALGSQGRQTSSQTYNTIEPVVPWLRPIGSRSTENMSGQSISRPALNLHTHMMQASDKNGQGSGGSNDPPTATQVYSQNLLSTTITSRSDMGNSDQWMLGSIRAAQNDREQQSTHFGPSTLNVSPAQLENNQMLPLMSESRTSGDSNVGSGQTGRSSADFLHQHQQQQQSQAQQQSQPQQQQQQQQSTSLPAHSGSEAADGTRSAGPTTTQPEMKYSELQALARPPFSNSSMIYDSHHNILTHGVSHFMMG